MHCRAKILFKQSLAKSWLGCLDKMKHNWRYFIIAEIFARPNLIFVKLGITIPVEKIINTSVSFYVQVYLHLIEGRVFCNEGGEKTDVDQNVCLEAKK